MNVGNAISDTKEAKEILLSTEEEFTRAFLLSLFELRRRRCRVYFPTWQKISIFLLLLSLPSSCLALAFPPSLVPTSPLMRYISVSRGKVKT